MSDDLKLQFDEFLRSVAISKNDSYVLLLGAGCSISSDIQSAYDCIWEWKKIIYKSNNLGTENWVENYKSPRVQERIQKWLDKQGSFVELDSEEEYSFYAKKCFPIEENRRQYFQKICTGKQPAIGYKTIPILAKQGVLDSIWTTNFDELVNTALIQGGVQGIDISLDTVDRINRRAQNNSEIPIVKLHGDFRYGELKNTDEELKSQDDTFRNKLVEYLGDKHLIVLGYSGRDKSLMSALTEAYSNSGGGRLFWCGYGNNASKETIQLLEHANKHNRSAYYVPTSGFDQTMIQLVNLTIEDNPSLKSEFTEIRKQSETSDDELTPFELSLPRVNKVIKSNMFPIEFPSEVMVLDANLGESPWKLVKELTQSEPSVAAIPYENGIWAFGLAEKIKTIFKNEVNGSLTRKPLTNIRIHHGGIHHLLLSAFVKSICSVKKLETNYRNKIWNENDSQTINGQKVFNAIRLALEKINGRFYLTLNPDFEIEQQTESNELRQQIGLRFFHRIFNDKYNSYVTKWRNVLLLNESLEFPIDSGSGFVFKINKAPLFTEVCDLSNSYTNNHEVPRKYLKLKAVQFSEVKLRFSTVHGNRTATDIHPMRGLVNFKPYETNLNSFMGDTINLAVICPDSNSEELNTFLQKQNNEIKTPKENDDYLIDFKGFNSVYGLSLNIPEKNSKDWLNVEDPKGQNEIETTLQLKNNICDNINQLTQSVSSKTIVIFIPERWEPFTGYNTKDEVFDLHDYIKAFCAEKGVTSQFIREKTIKDSLMSCQINWWLSLSYFVKSFRTPWVLDNADSSTAFAGLGYSINSKADNRGHIVLGCSHIYSSTGEGLKYKLSRISDDKIQWRKKKPHLSYDDAYEFGRNVINLFYESMHELPKRVVVHKRTFFTDDEKRGILDSLLDNGKIQNVDLIEVNFEDRIRYVSSKTRNGTTEIDGYSVSRGTCIQINDREALLYTHGVVPSVRNPKFNFYPGGRYIPKPLRIFKHHGNGSLEQISNEILGLTKMNWNSLNMYSQLPATISSSNEIARIGKLIEGTDKIDYDYRFFM